MNRLKEASTWAGLAVLLQVAKVLFPAYAVVIDGLSACAASAAVVIREGAQNGEPRN
jgi:hypothetical protein